MVLGTGERVVGKWRVRGSHVALRLNTAAGMIILKAAGVPLLNRHRFRQEQSLGLVGALVFDVKDVVHGCQEVLELGEAEFMDHEWEIDSVFDELRELC